MAIRATRYGQVMATGVTIQEYLWIKAREESLNISAFLSARLKDRYDDSKQKMLDYIQGKDREITELRKMIEAQKIKLDFMLKKS